MELAPETTSPLTHMRDRLELFACPACGSSLVVANDEVVCDGCGCRYRSEAGIPLLFDSGRERAASDEVTSRVRSFYEEHPFPNYEGLDDVGALIRKANTGHFGRWLNEQVPYDVDVLEVGCGTGQLSNFLGIAQRAVFGVDMTLASLRLGENFRRNNHLQRVGFYQMNLFRPAFRPGVFDLVICNGVLHHTARPQVGFEVISRLVKPGGYVLVGLYNTFGRFLTHARRLVFRLTGDRLRFLDPRCRTLDAAHEKSVTWYLDQYRNPHESSHTYGEVLRWFKETGFSFVSSLPPLTGGKGSDGEVRLFKPHPQGDLLDRVLVQTQLLFQGGEGGFFIMIGRKQTDDRRSGSALR
jgi:SAM-dependent methyltransferase